MYRFMKSTLLTLPTLAMACCLIGCGVDGAVNDAADKLSAAVENAADKVDPLAIKKILNENKTLDAKVRELEKLADQARIVKGVVNLSHGGKLELHIVVSELNKENGETQVRAMLDKDVKASHRIHHNTQGQQEPIVLNYSLLQPGPHKLTVDYLPVVGGHVIKASLKFRPPGETGKLDVIKEFTWRSSQSSKPLADGWHTYEDDDFDFYVVWDPDMPKQSQSPD